MTSGVETEWAHSVRIFWKISQEVISKEGSIRKTKGKKKGRKESK